MASFQELASVNLGELGWYYDASEIPSLDSCNAVIERLGTWWNGLDDRTRQILAGAAFAVALSSAGMCAEWPDMVNMFAGNLYGGFEANFLKIVGALRAAKEASA